MSRLSYFSQVSAHLRHGTDAVYDAIDAMLGDQSSQWRLTINAPNDGSYFQVMLRGDYAGREIVLAPRFEGAERTVEHIVSHLRGSLELAGVLQQPPA